MPGCPQRCSPMLLSPSAMHQPHTRLRLGCDGDLEYKGGCYCCTVQNTLLCPAMIGAPRDNLLLHLFHAQYGMPSEQCGHST